MATVNGVRSAVPSRSRLTSAHTPRVDDGAGREVAPTASAAATNSARVMRPQTAAGPPDAEKLAAAQDDGLVRDPPESRVASAPLPARRGYVEAAPLRSTRPGRAPVRAPSRSAARPLT